MGNHFTAKEFIAAIPGTGGIISAIADKVGCSWSTAKKYINSYPTIYNAWANERSRIVDKARHNIIQAITDKDTQISKWYLTMMDDEFRPVQEIKHSGDVAISYSGNIDPSEL